MEEGKWITLKDGRRILLKPKQVNINEANKYMSDKIRSAKVKTETMSENILGYERKHKYIKENGVVVGEVIYDYENGIPHIENINIHEAYRRKGYATRLLKEVQEEVGDQEIDFGILTKDGKQLIDKIGYEVKEEQLGKHEKKYKGKIRR